MCAQAIAPETPTGELGLHLVEEIHHRVVNAYTEAISSLALAAAGASLPQARAVLAGAADRLRAYAETHRVLLRPQGEGLLDLGDHLGRVCASMAAASLAERGVGVTLQTEDVWLDADRCWRVGLIVSELIRNAARHGLSGRPGEILVRLHADELGVTCAVVDPGTGGPDATPGRGRRVIAALAEDLGGAVDWRLTAAGHLAQLHLPPPHRSANPPRPPT